MAKDIRTQLHFACTAKLMKAVGLFIPRVGEEQRDVKDKLDRMEKK